MIEPWKNRVPRTGVTYVSLKSSIGDGKRGKIYAESLALYAGWIVSICPPASVDPREALQKSPVIL